MVALAPPTYFQAFGAQMAAKSDIVADPGEDYGSLLVLALLALVVGALAGLVGALFRLSLEQADRLRGALIIWAHGERVAGFLCVVAA